MHYVIGDVHGFFDELMELIRQIEAGDNDAQFIITGDLIDRGPKVMPTLFWAMNHVTPGGKYQCILGNHEDMHMKWYQSDYLPWIAANDIDHPERPLPRSRYDFSDQLIFSDWIDTKHVDSIMKFFSSLPLTLDISVINSAGRIQEYHIAHGWYPDSEEASRLTPEELRRKILWERCAGGYGTDRDYIVVHGHTPTVEKECEDEYYYAVDPEPINPGLIAYRKHTINVDGGRPYMEEQNRFCTLCAIGLETLEEYFADPIPEDYHYVENKYQKQMKLENTTA